MSNKNTYIKFIKHNIKLPYFFIIYNNFKYLIIIFKNNIKGIYQEYKFYNYILNIIGKINNIYKPYLYKNKDYI